MGEESRLREHAGGELQMSMGGGGGGGGGYSMSMSGGGGGGGMYVQSSSSSASASAGGASQQVMVTKSEVASKKTYQRSSKVSGPLNVILNVFVMKKITHHHNPYCSLVIGFSKKNVFACS